VVHVAVSVDGATTGLVVDVGRFYQLVSTWHEDVTLTGADTILAQEGALSAAPRPGPARDGPLLAVVDSRSRVSMWDALRDVGRWRAVTCAARRILATAHNAGRRERTCHRRRPRRPARKLSGRCGASMRLGS
jgi:2,5-diamino-6-(ribosylamino)-4(3H)-pyrimidinone 5'-phosphate reductase